MSSSKSNSAASHSKSKNIAKAIQSPTLQMASVSASTAFNFLADLSNSGVVIDFGLLGHKYLSYHFTVLLTKLTSNIPLKIKH